MADGVPALPGPGTLILIVLPLVSALVVLLSRRGAIRGLLDLRLRWLSLLWAAVAVKVLQLSGVGWAGPILTAHGGLVPELAMWTLGTAFAIVNLAALPRGMRAPLAVLVLGFTANTLVTVLNGAMPFSASAARTAGFSEEVIGDSGPFYETISGRTVLPVLADVIPVPLLQKVISVGDVLMFVGIAWLLVAVARGAVQAQREPVDNLPDRSMKGGVHA